MQDLHSIAGGRMFGSALERRLRPLAHGHVQAAIKCPRCESTNTKFCYYNNYNLSQPRHFCKSCRRYWTKGGVLRNVPVGGGCRKNKQLSKPKTSLPNNDQLPPAKTDANAVTAASTLPLKSGSNESSSESSGVTAPATEAAHTVPSFTSCSGSLLGVPNYEPPFMFPASDPTVLVGQRTEPGAYTADVGSFSGLVRGSAEAITGGVEPGSVMMSQQQCLRDDTCQQPEWESQDQCQTAMIGGLFDQTVQLDLSAMGSGGFGPSDWQVKDQGVFDLAPTTVDQAYWSQTQTLWTDRDQGRGPDSLLPLNFAQFLF